MNATDCYQFSLSDARAKIPTADGKRFAIMLTRGELVAELYEPKHIDPQQPHDRDECYVIVEGRGQFRMGDRVTSFAPGDFLFVPAGVVHRFEDFGETMTAWVIFYGPEGGAAND